MAADGSGKGALAHAERAALNTACSLLDDAKKVARLSATPPGPPAHPAPPAPPPLPAPQVAHKLAHAASHAGQERLYLGKVTRSLDRLDPGDSVVLPAMVGGNWVLFVVQR